MHSTKTFIDTFGGEVIDQIDTQFIRGTETINGLIFTGEHFVLSSISSLLNRALTAINIQLVDVDLVSISQLTAPSP